MTQNNENDQSPQPPQGQPPQAPPPTAPPTAPPAAPPTAPPTGPPTGPPAYQPGYPAPGYAQPPPATSRTGLIVGLVLAGVLILGGAITAGVLLIGNSDDDSTDAGSGNDPELTGEVLEGNGYSYTMPEGWNEVTEEVLATNPGGAIDTVVAWGEAFEGSRSNVIVEAGSAGGESDPEAIRATWESNMAAATGATPAEMEGTTIAEEEAIGAILELTNDKGIEVQQFVYLVIHDGDVYSIGLSAEAGDEESSELFEQMLASWSWQ